MHDGRYGRTRSTSSDKYGSERETAMEPDGGEADHSPGIRVSEHEVRGREISMDKTRIMELRRTLPDLLRDQHCLVQACVPSRNREEREGRLID